MRKPSGWRTPRKQDPINHLIPARTNSQRPSQHAQGLHRSASGPLCVMASSLVILWDSWMYKRVGLWFLVPSLELFSPTVVCFV